MSLGEQFEEFLHKVFSSEGIQVVSQSTARDAGVDLLLLAPNQHQIIVQAKISRSRQISVRSLISAILMLERARQKFGAFKAVLAIASRVDGVSLAFLAQEFPRIVIYDFARLKYLAGKHANLAVEFEEIVQNSIYMTERLRDVEPEYTNVDELFVDDDFVEPEWSEDDYVAMPKGAELCQRMYAVSEGEEGAKDFETAVTNALKFLFDDELTGWADQKATEGRMSLFDLVARISGGHDFWRMLIESFRSRYVIFEFKNYSDKIGQSEIYTTEKYLFATALRNTAIIIARNGASENAFRAASGALKEHGKLILIISASDICEMLELADGGNEASDFMLGRLDDFLTRLER